MNDSIAQDDDKLVDTFSRLYRTLGRQTPDHPLRERGGLVARQWPTARVCLSSFRSAGLLVSQQSKTGSRQTEVSSISSMPRRLRSLRRLADARIRCYLVQNDMYCSSSHHVVTVSNSVAIVSARGEYFSSIIRFGKLIKSQVRHSDLANRGHRLRSVIDVKVLCSPLRSHRETRVDM